MFIFTWCHLWICSSLCTVLKLLHFASVKELSVINTSHCCAQSLYTVTGLVSTLIVFCRPLVVGPTPLLSDFHCMACTLFTPLVFKPMHFLILSDISVYTLKCVLRIVRAHNLSYFRVFLSSCIKIEEISLGQCNH